MKANALSARLVKRALKAKNNSWERSEFFCSHKLSVTKTVKDMEKLGFVEKETTETDGRFVYIKTTRTGRDLVDKYVDEYFGNLSEDLGGITDEDADKMIEVVEKFYIVMSNRK